MKTNKISLKRQIKYLQKTIYLKCLECCNCQIKEVIDCEVKGCPLWETRPVEANGLYVLVKQLRKKNLTNSEAKI